MIKQTNHNTTENRSLHDRAYDLFGEMLLERETEALLAQIGEETAGGSTAEMDAFFALHDAKYIQKINRHFRRHRFRTLFCETLPKIGQIAAILIAVLAIAGGVAFAASHTLRVQVMKLLVNVETEYTELSLAEDTQASFDVPAEWRGEYYPAYIPEGMAVSTVFPWLGYNSVEYMHSDTGKIQISFSENDDSTISNVDTENAIVRDIMINGNIGFLSIKNNQIIICWDNGRVYFILITTDFDETTALKIAESVVRVK